MRAKSSEFVSTQLALSQASQLSTRAEEHPEVLHRELYTASIHDDSYEQTNIEEVHVLDISEIREVAFVKEEQETYEVPGLEAVIVPEEKEVVIAVDEVVEVVASIEEDRIQEHDVVSVVTKVDEIIEVDHLEREEFEAEAVEDVAFDEDFPVSELVVTHQAQTVETEEPKTVHIVESVSHPPLEETVKVVEEEEEEYEEEQEEVQVDDSGREEQEIVYGDESPITDVKYTSLADPATTELVREKIETIEEVVSRMERKFELSSAEVYEGTFTADSSERVVSDKMVYESTERVKEEFRSEVTEDASETTQDFSEIKSELVESLESQHDLDTSKEHITEVSEVEEIITKMVSVTAETQFHKSEAETVGLGITDHSPDLEYRSDTGDKDEQYFAVESAVTESFEKTLDEQEDDMRDTISPSETTEFVDMKTPQPTAELFQTSQPSWDAAGGPEEVMFGESQEQAFESDHDTAHIISTEIEGEEDEEETDDNEEEDKAGSLERADTGLLVDTEGNELKDVVKGRATGDVTVEGAYEEEIESVAATAGSDVAGVEEVEQESFIEMNENGDKVLVDGADKAEYIEETLLAVSEGEGEKETFKDEKEYIDSQEYQYSDEEGDNIQVKEEIETEDKEEFKKEEEVEEEFEDITRERENEQEFENKDQDIYEKCEEEQEDVSYGDKEEDRYEEAERQEYGFEKEKEMEDKSEDEEEDKWQEYKMERGTELEDKKEEYDRYKEDIREEEEGRFESREWSEERMHEEEDNLSVDDRDLPEAGEDLLTEMKVSTIEAKVSSLPDEEADEIEETVQESKVKITYTQYKYDDDDYEGEDELKDKEREIVSVTSTEYVSQDHEDGLSEELGVSKEQEIDQEVEDDVDDARYVDETLVATESHRSFATLPDEEEDEIEEVPKEKFVASKAKTTKSEPVFEEIDGYGHEEEYTNEEYQLSPEEKLPSRPTEDISGFWSSSDHVDKHYTVETVETQHTSSISGHREEVRITETYLMQEASGDSDRQTFYTGEEFTETYKKDAYTVRLSDDGRETGICDFEEEELRAEADTEDWVLLNKDQLTPEEIVLAATLKMVGSISVEEDLEHEDQEKEIDNLAIHTIQTAEEKRWEEEISDEDLVEERISPEIVEEVLQADTVGSPASLQYISVSKEVPILTAIDSDIVEQVSEEMEASAEEAEVQRFSQINQAEHTYRSLEVDATVESTESVKESRVSGHHRALIETQMGSIEIEEDEDEDINMTTSHTDEHDEVHEEPRVELADEVTVEAVLALAEENEMPAITRSLVSDLSPLEEKAAVIIETPASDIDYEVVTSAVHTVSEQPDEIVVFDEGETEKHDIAIKEELTIYPITPSSDADELSLGVITPMDESIKKLDEPERIDRTLALPDEESESVSVSEKAIGSSPEEQENLDDENVLDQDEEFVKDADEEFDKEADEEYVKEDVEVEKHRTVKEIDDELDQEIEEQEQLTAALMSQYSKDSEDEGGEEEEEERDEEEEVQRDGDDNFSETYTDREEAAEESFEKFRQQTYVVQDTSLELIAEQSPESELVRCQDLGGIDAMESVDGRNLPNVDSRHETSAVGEYFIEEEASLKEVTYTAKEEEEDVDQAFIKYEDEPEVIVPIDAEVGEDAEIVLEDIDKAFEKYEHEPEVSVPIDAEVETMFTEEQEVCDETSEVCEESTVTISQTRRLSVEENIDMSRDTEHDVELSRAVVQEALHTDVEIIKKTEEFAEDVVESERARETSMGIMAEMQALENQQAQEDLLSEDDLDDDQYEEEHETDVIEYDHELGKDSGSEDEGGAAISQVRVEETLHTIRSDVLDATDYSEASGELEQSIDRMEEMFEKLDSSVLETCALAESNQSVDRTEIKLEQDVDVLDREFVAENSVDRVETFTEAEEAVSFEGAVDVNTAVDTEDTFEKGVYEEEKEVNNDEFEEDSDQSEEIGEQLEASYTDIDQQKEGADIPESFIDRREQFLEVLQDVVRPDDDDRKRLTTFHTDFGVSGEAQTESFPHFQNGFSPSDSQPRDNYDQSQGPLDGMSIGLHLPRSPFYPTSSTEVHDRSGSPSDLDEEITEIDTKISAMKQMEDFDEESQDEEFLEASSQPQEDAMPTRSGQEIAGQTFMASSISGSDYTSPSEYAHSETTGTGSYYTAPSEIMSSSSCTAQSETMTGSEYTMTGSEYGHEADGEEYESEGRLSADISQQIFIEHKFSKKREDQDGGSSSDDEFDDGMDRLDRPPSPSDFTLIASQDTEKLNISLGLTPQVVTRTTLSEEASHQAVEGLSQTQQDRLHVQYDTDIEKDSLQDDEEEHEDYDEEDDEDDEARDEYGERMDLAVSDRPPSPSDFTLVASQDQESLQRILNIEDTVSPEQETGSPMQWEQDLEKAILDADAMSTASSDAALMIGLDHISVTGTDNNTMSGVSSESGQQVDSPKEQFCGESPLDDDIEDRQHLYQAYMREMESDRMTTSEEELKDRVWTDEFPGEDNLKHEEEEFESKAKEVAQHVEEIGYDMYEDYVESQKSLQEKEDSKETLSLEVGYSSPPAHFDDMSQEEMQEGVVSVTELEERLRVPAHEHDGFREDVTDERDEREGRERDGFPRAETSEDAEEKEYTTQLEAVHSRVEVSQSSQAFASSDLDTDDQFGRGWYSEQRQEESFSAQDSYSYSYQDTSEMKSSEETFRQSSHTETRSEYKASSSASQSETRSKLDSHLEAGDNLFHHDLEAEEKRLEEERHDLAAMAIHTVDKMSSSSSEVAQLDDFDDQDIEIREVSEETSEETDVEDQFSPVIAQTAGPAFGFEEVSSLSLGHGRDKKMQQSDLIPGDMEGHEEKLLKLYAVSAEEESKSQDVKDATYEEVETTKRAALHVSSEGVGYEVEDVEVKTGDEAVRQCLHTEELVYVKGDVALEDEAEAELEGEIEDIDDTEFEPELCGLSHSDDQEIEGDEAEANIQEIENEEIVDLMEAEGEVREEEVPEGDNFLAYDNMAFREEEEEVLRGESFSGKRELWKQETRDISPEDLEEKPVAFDFPDDFKEEMSFQRHYEQIYTETMESSGGRYEHTEMAVETETSARQGSLAMAERKDREVEEDQRMEPSDDIGSQEVGHNLTDVAQVEAAEESDILAEDEASIEDGEESDEVSSKSSSDSGGVEVFDEQTGQYTRLPWEIAHQYKRQFSESFVEEQKSSVKPQKSIDMGTFYRRDKSKDEEFLEKSFYDESETVSSVSVAKRRVTFGLEQEDVVSMVVNEEEIEPRSSGRSQPCEPYEQIDDTHDADVLVTIMESRQHVRSEIAKQVYDPEFPETPKQDTQFDMSARARHIPSVFDESEEDAMFSYQRVSVEKYHYSEQQSEMISVVSKESRMAQQELLLQESLDEEDRSMSPSRDGSSKMLRTTFEEIPPPPPAHPTHFPMAVHSVGKSLADNEIYESSETERDSTEEKLSPIEETTGLDDFEEDDRTLKSTPPVEKKVTFQTDRLTTRASEQSVDDFKASSSSSELSVEPTLLAASYDLDSGNVCHVVTAYDISPDTVEKQGPIEIAGKSILSSPEDDVFETDALTSYKAELSPEGPVIPRGHLLSGTDVCPSPPMPVAPVSTPREGSEREDLSSSLQSASTILERLRHDERMDSKDGEDTTLQEDDMSSPHEEVVLSELRSEESSPDGDFGIDVRISEMHYLGEPKENGLGPHTEDGETDDVEGAGFVQMDHSVDRREIHVLNGPTEVEYIPEYDGGDDSPFGGFRTAQEEDSPSEPSFYQPDLIDSDMASSLEAKPDIQQATKDDDDDEHPEGEKHIQPSHVSSVQAKPDIQQATKDDDDDDDHHPEGEKRIQPSHVSLVQAKPDVQQATKDDDDDDDHHPEGEKRIQPTHVSSVQAKPDVQQATKDDDDDDDHLDGEKRIQPSYLSLVQAKPDVQQPEDNGSPPEVHEPIQPVMTTSSQAKPDIQQVEGEGDEPDGEDLIQPSIMNTSGAKPDIQQPADDKDNGYPVVEVPIQPTITTSGQLKQEERSTVSTVSMVGSESGLALTDIEQEGIQSSGVVEDEEFIKHMEQEISVGGYSPERGEGEDFDERMYSSREAVYHGKRALDSLEDTTFSKVFEERDEAVPEGYAMSGEPLLQDEPALQEGDEDLELEEEEEFDERPEEELIRLEEAPAESDEEEEEGMDIGAEKSREQSYSVISTGLSSADLLRVSSGSQSDLDRPLSPTPDALRQGFFGGNFTPPQSGMYTPPITGSFTPPQAGQDTSGDDPAMLEKAAVSLVGSVFEDVKAKVSCQTSVPKEVDGDELRKDYESVVSKPTVVEETVEEELTLDDEYGQLDMSSDVVKRSGVTLVKQISEDIPGIILTQHLHEELNEDEFYGYSPQPESISEDEEDRYLKEMAEMIKQQKEELEETTPGVDLGRDNEMGGVDTVKCVVLEASRKPIVQGFVTDDVPLTPSAPDAEEEAKSPPRDLSFLASTDPGSGFVFTEPTHTVFHHEDGLLFVSTELESGSDLLDEIVEPMLSPEDHGDSSSVDSFATVVAAEAEEDYEADENRLAEIASMTSSFTSDIQVSFPDENRKDTAEDFEDTEDDDMSMERSQEWLSTTPDDKDIHSDTSNDSDKFEFVDRAALSVITEMSDEDKFEMIEREDLESEAGLSDNLGSSPDTNIQQSPGISNLRFFGRGTERDDASISSSLAEFEKLEKAIPISSSLSSIERDMDRESFGGSYDERKLVGFHKLKEGEESASIASSLAEFEHLEQVIVVSSSGSSVEKQTPESKSSGGSGENTSNSISSSLADFERIEQECQADSDDKKSSVESSSRPSEASSCTSLNEFERLEREIAVAAQLEEEAQKIVSILESGVLMECAKFGSSDFSEVGGVEEKEDKDSLDGEGHDEIEHDSLSEEARLGHDEDVDSLDGESSEVTEMASSVVFTGPDLAVAQTLPADLDTDSLQGEALMQLSSDSLILEQRLKSSDSTRFDTDSLFGQDDRMVQSGDSLEFGGQSSGGHSSEKQEDKNVPGDDLMQTSVDSLELDNSKEEAKESVEKDQQQDDSLMMVSVESAAWSMGSSGGTGQSMSESHTDSSHSHDIMQVSTESDNIKSGAGPEKTSIRSEQILASETSISKESREYHHLEQHQQWHRAAETTVQHVTSSSTRQQLSATESKSKPKRESPKFSEYEEPEQEESPYLARGPYQDVKKVYTMAEWEAMKQSKKEELEREAKSSALSSSPDLSENSDKQSPPSQSQVDPPSSQQTSLICYSTSTTTTSSIRGGRDRDETHTSDEDVIHEGGNIS